MISGIRYLPAETVLVNECTCCESARKIEAGAA